MMKTIPIDIIGGTKFARYEKITSETTVNMMVSGVDIKKPALVPFSGYEKNLDIGQGESRGIFFSTRLNELIVVVRDRIYRINTNLHSRFIGTIDTTSGNVYISENFNSQIGIADGSKVYIYDYSVSQIIKPIIDFTPIYLDYQDGRFIATDNAGQWHLSEINNGIVWPPLLRQELQTKADILRASVVLDRQLWIIGTKAAEVWYNQGLALFPYARDNSVSIDYGAVSQGSIATGFGILVWLAKNEKSGITIVYTTGGKPQELSPEGLDFVLSELDNPEDSSGFLFQQDGHIFYQLAFNKDNLSFVYDFTSKMFYTLTDENRDRYIAKKVAFFNNRLYFISFVDGALYQMSTSITTYDGKEIPRIRIINPVRFPKDGPFIINRVNIQLEQGQSSDFRRVDLSISKDGGMTYGSTVCSEMNKVGNRRGTVEFRGLGRAIDLSMEFRFWSKGRFVITSGTMDVYQ